MTKHSRRVPPPIPTRGLLPSSWGRLPADPGFAGRSGEPAFLLRPPQHQGIIRIFLPNPQSDHTPVGVDMSGSGSGNPNPIEMTPASESANPSALEIYPSDRRRPVVDAESRHPCMCGPE